jgi:acetyl-CoA carboxylase biotin carboxyl carrier protein
MPELPEPMSEPMPELPESMPEPVPELPWAPGTEATPEAVTTAGPGGQPPTAEAAELIALIDRLESVLERSGLAELEVGAGTTTIVLRSPAALAPVVAPVLAPSGLDDGAAAGRSPAEPEPSGHHLVLAPLTGLYYTAPSPDAAPYVRVGGQVVVGQVIGLIEAMKLYNEIKSDMAGRVVRVVAENGKLVKARQALIEVEPS